MQYVLENAVINVGYNKDLRTAEKGCAGTGEYRIFI